MAVGCNFSPHRIFAAFVESLWVDVAKNNTLTLTLTLLEESEESFARSSLATVPYVMRSLSHEV